MYLLAIPEADAAPFPFLHPLYFFSDQLSKLTEHIIFSYLDTTQ